MKDECENAWLPAAATAVAGGSDEANNNIAGWGRQSVIDGFIASDDAGIGALWTIAVTVSRAVGTCG